MADQFHKVDTQGIAVGGGLATLTAITLNEWVAIITIVYFAVQIVIALPKLIDSLKKLWRAYGWGK